MVLKEGRKERMKECTIWFEGGGARRVQPISPPSGHLDGREALEVGFGSGLTEKRALRLRPPPPSPSLPWTRHSPTYPSGAAQIAMTEPKGPVYLFGAREVMEESLPLPPVPIRTEHWQPLAPPGGSHHTSAGPCWKKIALALTSRLFPLLSRPTLARPLHCFPQPCHQRTSRS